MKENRISINKDKRYSLNITKHPIYGLFNPQIKSIKKLPMEDLLKTENKISKKLQNNHLKKQTIKLYDMNAIKKAFTNFTKIGNKLKYELEFLLAFKKITNKKLKDKYNYKFIERFGFMKKEEIPTQYDYNQLTYLIEKKRCRILSLSNELFFFNNIQEFLKDIYNYKQSLIILRYLLFFIYDKDIITYVEKPDNEKNKKYILSNFKKLSILLKKKKELRQITGDNIKTINKYIKNDESIIIDLEKINNNLFISYDFSKVKYLYIYDVPQMKINNCIPNIFPNGIRVMKILKNFLNKKKSQKLYNNKVYSVKKNTSNKNDNINYNKKNENYLLDNISILSEEEKNNKFYKNDYSINYHINNIKREKNDIDIIDIEKLIRNISEKEKSKKVKKVNIKNKISVKKTSLKLYKKAFSNKKLSFFDKSKNIDNFSPTNEKLHISDNSTSLSNKYKIEKQDKKSKENEIQNYSSSRKILPYRDKKTKKKVNILKDNYINVKKKPLFLSPSKKNENLSSSTNINIKKDLLLFSFPNLNHKNNEEKKNNQNIKKIFSNNIIKKYKYKFKHINEFSPVNKSYKIINYKLRDLKEFIRAKKKLSNKSISNNPIELKSYYSYNKGFEYSPEIYIFKNKNENIWEEGEDFTTQKQCENLSKHIMNNIKKKYIQYNKNLKKLTSLKEIIKYGNIYENKFYSSFN